MNDPLLSGGRRTYPAALKSKRNRYPHRNPVLTSLTQSPAGISPDRHSWLILNVRSTVNLWILQLSHNNGGDLTPVIRLFAVRRPPKTEEHRFVLVGTMRLLVDGLEAQEPEPIHDEGR